MNRKIEKILSLPKSLYANIKLFGYKGLRIPILIRYDVKLKRLGRGTVALDKFSSFKIIYGFGGTDSVYARSSSLDLIQGSLIRFHGNSQFSRGVMLKNKGVIEFGNHFSANKNFSISCSNSISFGEDCLLGWDVSIRDSDGHKIINKKSLESKSVIGEINIGNHVWIASFCHILKSTVIPSGCVVGYRSLVNRRFTEPDCIIAGHPAVVVRRNIEWVL